MLQSTRINQQHIRISYRRSQGLVTQEVSIYIFKQYGVSKKHNDDNTDGTLNQFVIRLNRNTNI